MHRYVPLPYLTDRTHTMAMLHRHTLLTLITLWLLLLPELSFAMSYTTPPPSIGITGRVRNAKDHAPIGWATVGISETNQGVVCDADGRFTLPLRQGGTYTLVVRCVGFAPYSRTLSVQGLEQIDISLRRLSIELPEVEVLGAYRKDKSEVVIGQEAMQNIQPVSIKDILLLLPGAVTTTPGIGDFKGVTNRQVGQDDNSSLGTSIMIDGAPITNDASRVQMQGLTGMSRFSTYLPDRVVTKRSSLNSGIDLRTLSTNHYDRVEVEQGISSASEGNLSSGAIKLHPKRGVTPWEGRAKVDPLFKLAYIGKGIALGSTGYNSLHIGGDVVDYRSDPRERLERYTRATAQLSYAYHRDLGDTGGVLDVTATLHQTASIQNSRTDELVEQQDERYNTEYYRTTLVANARWAPQLSWLRTLSWRSTVDYTYDLLSRKYLYLSGRGPAVMPISREMGLQEGEFLPTSYYAYYKMDNQPLALQTTLSAESPMAWLAPLQQTLLYGVDYSIAKNWGRGAVIDPSRPPYPGDNTFIWVRPNYAIPALSNIAAFLEDRLFVSLGSHRIDGNVGLRATQMLNLPHNYRLAHEILLDPRIKLSWTYTAPSGFATAVRLGYGVAHKLPTLDYLYPDNVYRYFSALNAYYSDPKRDHLMTYAIKHDPSNPNLRAMSNEKKEIGIDLSYQRYTLAVTLFQEDMNSGYAYAPAYYPITYPTYRRPIGGSLPVGKRPVKEDFYEDLYQDFTSLSTVQNSERTVKRGIEYRLRTPYFKAIRTQFELNGAYYHTLYASAIPVMYRPEIIEFDVKYPYVGIYGKGDHRHYHRVNTNLWATTHIPEWGVILTNFFQVIWFSKSYYGREQSPYPYELMDLNGRKLPVGEKEIAQMNDLSSPMRYLNRSLDELYYRANIKPISVRMSFKGTKQLGEHIRLSFFIDNIIDISPKYLQKDKTTAREWVVPYFGLETSVKF